MEKTEKNDSYSHILKYTGIFGGVQGLSILIGLVRNKFAALLWELLVWDLLRFLIQPLTWWFRLLILVFLPVVCVKSQNSMMLPTSNFPPPFAYTLMVSVCSLVGNVCLSVLQSFA